MRQFCRPSPLGALMADDDALSSEFGRPVTHLWRQPQDQTGIGFAAPHRATPASAGVGRPNPRRPPNFQRNLGVAIPPPGELAVPTPSSEVLPSDEELLQRWRALFPAMAAGDAEEPGPSSSTSGTAVARTRSWRAGSSSASRSSSTSAARSSTTRPPRASPPRAPGSSA